MLERRTQHNGEEQEAKRHHGRTGLEEPTGRAFVGDPDSPDGKAMFPSVRVNGLRIGEYVAWVEPAREVLLPGVGRTTERRGKMVGFA